MGKNKNWTWEKQELTNYEGIYKTKFSTKHIFILMRFGRLFTR